MTDTSNDPYRKPALVLAAVAAVTLGGGLVFAFIIPQEEFDYRTPAAMAINALGVVGLLSIMGVGVIALAAIIKNVEKSASMSPAAATFRQKASELTRPRVTTTSGMSTADELAKWATLLDTGVVTQEEFEAARAELLKTPH